MTTASGAAPDGTERLPRLSPEQKLSIAHGLRGTAWELTAAGVRLRHPDRAESWVQERVREIFLRATAS